MMMTMINLMMFLMYDDLQQLIVGRPQVHNGPNMHAESSLQIHHCRHHNHHCHHHHCNQYSYIYTIATSQIEAETALSLFQSNPTHPILSSLLNSEVILFRACQSNYWKSILGNSSRSSVTNCMQQHQICRPIVWQLLQQSYCPSHSGGHGDGHGDGHEEMVEEMVMEIVMGWPLVREVAAMVVKRMC